MTVSSEDKVEKAQADTKEDIINFLSEDDKEETIDLKEPKKEDDKEEVETKENDDKEELEEKEEKSELEEIEEELEEPDEDKLQLMVPARRRDILTKYPKLFKDFPYLETAYYREQQFTELLPTLDDAREAVKKAETLDNFEKDLLSGNTEKILKSVFESDKNAFYKIVDEYLPTLAKVDERAYHHVLGNTIKHTIVAMVQEAKKSDNDTLKNAAAILNQFVFGSSDFDPPNSLAKEDSQKEDKISEKERAFTQKQFNSAKSDLTTKVDNILKATIQNNIDPKESMTEYVRKNATRESMETIQELISQDARFSQLIDKLWENAFKNDFDTNSINKIKSAYLSKAKTLLPTVIKKARNEALKGMGKRVSSDKDDTDEEKSDRKGPLPSGRPAASHSSGKSSKEQAKEIPSGMKSIDFLMKD